MSPTANENDRNLLDSAARVFRGRVTPGSRYHELLDRGMPAKPFAERHDPASPQTGELDRTQPEMAKIGLPATERLSRSTGFALPQIGDMPPAPPSLRGRVGAVLVGVVRRALFWYTAQIRTLHAVVADAARELAPALQDLDMQQRRQRALIAEVRHRLTVLERQVQLNQTGLASSVAAQASFRDEVNLYRTSSQDRARRLEQTLASLDHAVGSLDQTVGSLQQAQSLFENENRRRNDTLAARLGELDDAVARAREIHSSFREEEERLRAAAAVRWERMEKAVGQFQQAHASSREQESLQRSGLLARLAQIDAALAAIRQTKAAFEEDFQAETKEIRRQVHEAGTHLLRQELRLKMLIGEIRKRAPQTDGGAVLACELAHIDDPLLAGHAALFRGARPDIKKKLAIYLPYAQEAFGAAMQSPALDLGCGRGEWIELLAEAGIPATGIDLNRELVSACRRMGFDVIEGEIFQFLRTLPDESRSIVTAFHVLEHISFPNLVELVDQAVRILKPGGIAIFETPNPKNLFVSSNNFYLDPTHRKPIPSEFLAFLVEARGLCDPKVIPLSPYPDYFHLPESDCPAVRFINERFFGPQDYGVVGRKL